MENLVALVEYVALWMDSLFCMERVVACISKEVDMQNDAVFMRKCHVFEYQNVNALTSLLAITLKSMGRI